MQDRTSKTEVLCTLCNNEMALTKGKMYELEVKIWKCSNCDNRFVDEEDAIRVRELKKKRK